MSVPDPAITDWVPIYATSGGPQGPKGDKGDTGNPSTVPGPPGVGIPLGGTTGQALLKRTNSDFDTIWNDISTRPPPSPVHFSNGNISNPYAFFTIIAFSAHHLGCWQMVNGFTASVFGTVKVPEGMTSGNIRIVFIANATAGAARYQVGYSAISPDETMQTTFADAGYQNLVVPGVAWGRKDGVFPVTGLLGGDLLTLSVNRIGADAADSLAVDSYLVGAWLEAA